MFCPAQSQLQKRSQSAGQGFSTLQRQVIQCPNNFHTPAIGTQNVQRTKTAKDLPLADRGCYNCGEMGHYTNRCPSPRTHANQLATATPTLTHGANYILVAVNQNYARERVNHVAVKEA
jgi:hypothetical protein